MIFTTEMKIFSWVYTEQFEHEHILVFFEFLVINQIIKAKNLFVASLNIIDFEKIIRYFFQCIN